jgi:hypothetical protein
MVNEPEGKELDYFSDQMTYTGWWPSDYQTGQGIGIVDNNIIWSGEWQPVSNFPNYGKDIYDPEHLFSYDIYDLTHRVMQETFWGYNYVEIKNER